jgi:phytoene dehydrogenase-like protein
MPAAILGGAAFTFFNDYWTVKTGMQSWADCLADRFRELGGELRLGSEVEKIVTRGGAAAGVMSRGEFHEADYVVAAGDYKKTFLRLIDDQGLLSPGLRDRIEKAPVSEGFFTVYLGLDLPSDKMKEYLGVPHVYFSDEYWDADVHDSRDESYFEKAWIVLYSPSLMNPELAPENHSSLMIQAMAPPQWMDNWGGGDRKVYRELKDTVRSALIDKTSLLIPGLRRHIVFEDAATPLTYERFTHNTWGASSAWSWNPSQKFHKNIWDSSVETPVKNVLIGSSWALQLGGIPGAIQAALACVKRIK